MAFESSVSFKPMSSIQKHQFNDRACYHAVFVSVSNVMQLSWVSLFTFHHSDKAAVFVQIQVEAYMLTRSVHVPGGILAATRFEVNPDSSNARMYHGFKPADRSSTLPPIFIARLTACA